MLGIGLSLGQAAAHPSGAAVVIGGATQAGPAADVTLRYTIAEDVVARAMLVPADAAAPGPDAFDAPTGGRIALGTIDLTPGAGGPLTPPLGLVGDYRLALLAEGAVAVSPAFALDTSVAELREAVVTQAGTTLTGVQALPDSPNLLIYFHGRVPADTSPAAILATNNPEGGLRFHDAPGHLGVRPFTTSEGGTVVFLPSVPGFAADQEVRALLAMGQGFQRLYLSTDGADWTLAASHLREWAGDIAFPSPPRLFANAHNGGNNPGGMVVNRFAMWTGLAALPDLDAPGPRAAFFDVEGGDARAADAHAAFGDRDGGLVCDFHSKAQWDSGQTLGWLDFTRTGAAMPRAT